MSTWGRNPSLLALPYSGNKRYCDTGKCRKTASRSVKAGFAIILLHLMLQESTAEIGSAVVLSTIEKRKEKREKSKERG
jgi:hypothetical protein